MFYSFLSCVQCLGVESANYFHLWLPRLDELWSGNGSSQADEGPLWNHSGSAGFSLSTITCLSCCFCVWAHSLTCSFVCIFLKTFIWILREFYFCLNAGWTLCVHRQLKRFPFSCFACLPQISLTWSWFWFWFIAWRFDISLEER